MTMLRNLKLSLNVWTPEAVQMEDMATRQFLVARGELHFLPTNDAHIIASNQVLF